MELRTVGKNYHENLYSSQEETKDTPEKLPPCSDDEPDILLSEVQEAIKKLKNQKAPGIDDIQGELLKQADDSVAIILQKLCNSVWKSRIWPEDWKKSVFLTLPKKGDASECKNHRTIALVPHASKILLHIINERLRPHKNVNFLLSSWFHERAWYSRSNCQHTSYNGEVLWIPAKDFSLFHWLFKGLWVRYSALWTAMQEMGIPSHLIHLIHNLYDGQAACVRTEKEIVTGLVWDREFDRGAFYHHHSSTCMQNT